MENQTTNKLTPVNNKTLYLQLGDIFGKVINGSIDNETANTLCNIATKMQKSQDYELDRAKLQHLLNQSPKIREVEAILLDDKQANILGD